MVALWRAIHILMWSKCVFRINFLLKIDRALALQWARLYFQFTHSFSTIFFLFCSSIFSENSNNHTHSTNVFPQFESLHFIFLFISWSELQWNPMRVYTFLFLNVEMLDVPQLVNKLCEINFDRHGIERRKRKKNLNKKPINNRSIRRDIDSIYTQRPPIEISIASSSFRMFGLYMFHVGNSFFLFVRLHSDIMFNNLSDSHSIWWRERKIYRKQLTSD